ETMRCLLRWRRNMDGPERKLKLEVDASGYYTTESLAMMAATLDYLRDHGANFASVTYAMMNEVDLKILAAQAEKTDDATQRNYLSRIASAVLTFPKEKQLPMIPLKNLCRQLN